ncbi:MAG TPA: hypothetical protein PK559_13360 [Ignavibacteriaceae bacterium]|nr:hypothetical protein [Ignavibacteriaceae bacterium]
MRTEFFNIPAEILDAVSKRLEQWQSINLVERLWTKDATLWKKDPKDHKELADRLGWLQLPFEIKTGISEFEIFANSVKTKFSHVLLLGMGGSSLCPEVLSKTFGSSEGYPLLSIVDTTHPQVIRDIEDKYDLTKTLFIMASKSGGTAETLSFFYRFYDALGKIIDNPGDNFIALTDPGTSLEKLAIEKKFLKTFSTPTEVGGRYSALTPFGLVPAALMGINLDNFAYECSEFANTIKSTNLQDNLGVYLGALIGECSLNGIDKLPFFVSPQISSYPQWVEQLVAESTGKEGKGILPVEGEHFSDISNYGRDRLFIFTFLDGDSNFELSNHFEKVKYSGFPILKTTFQNKYQLAAELFKWEVATAISGIVLQINPFDQPDVQIAKTLANEGLAEYQKNGSLPKSEPNAVFENIEVYADSTSDSLSETISSFMSNLLNDEYVALLNFVSYGDAIEKAISQIRKNLFEKYKVTITNGFGPRFLHSTGQLHKGGSSKCRFIQITSEIQNDVEVPNKGYSFGTLITAQALGDLKALKNNKRKCMRINIKESLVESLKIIANSI